MQASIKLPRDKGVKRITTIIDIVSIIQSVVTIAAIVVAGGFAIFKFRLFRAFQPHLSISQEVTHRFTDHAYVHLAVTVTLNNNSRVRVELNKARLLVQQVRPITAEELEDLYAEVFVSGKVKNIQWRVLDEFQPTWPKGTFVVEPGESHKEVYEFIIASDIRTILVYAYFYNSKHSPGSAEGWTATTIHDILQLT